MQIPIPSFTIQAGQKTRGPFTTSIAFSRVDLVLNFNAFPPTGSLSILIQVSTDGGVTQRDFGSWSTTGGLHDRHGATNRAEMIFAVSDMLPMGTKITLNTNASEDMLVDSGTLDVT